MDDHYDDQALIILNLRAIYNNDDYNLIGPGKFWFFIAENKESSHCSAVKDPNGEAEAIY